MTALRVGLSARLVTSFTVTLFTAQLVASLMFALPFTRHATAVTWLSTLFVTLGVMTPVLTSLFTGWALAAGGFTIVLTDKNLLALLFASHMQSSATTVSTRSLTGMATHQCFPAGFNAHSRGALTTPGLEHVLTWATIRWNHFTAVNSVRLTT